MTESKAFGRSYNDVLSFEMAQWLRWGGVGASIGGLGGLHADAQTCRSPGPSIRQRVTFTGSTERSPFARESAVASRACVQSRGGQGATTLGPVLPQPRTGDTRDAGAARMGRNR